MKKLPTSWCYFRVSTDIFSGFDRCYFRISIKIVNAILPKESREFDELVIEMGGDVRFVYHSEMWWLSRERVG